MQISLQEYLNGPLKTELLASNKLGNVMDPWPLTGLLNAVCDLKPLRFQVK